MIVIILSSLLLTNVNCQFAHLWLNYQHFQCAQSVRNHHEAVQHQYLCVSSLIWMCVRDTNSYTAGSTLSLACFCGFINGQNVKQSQTIWNIHVIPNIHVHFLKFSLFNYYWHCDVEYIRVTTTNKSSTFCGNRLPWIYDASDVSVNISLSTDRFDSLHYQVELQYYGAYVQNYQDSVVFIEPASILKTQLPDIMQHKFETFHFISNSRLDFLKFVAVNMCSKIKLVCHDGPGTKALVLQFICNQSICECRSSTFQMFCKFSVIGIGCLNVPQFHYLAQRAAEGEFNSISFRLVDLLNLEHGKSGMHGRLEIDETVNRSPTKYIYNHSSLLQTFSSDFRFINNKFHSIFTVNKMSVSFPYMIYEGHSCMYGGMYMVDTLSPDVTEVLSHCDPVSLLYGKELFLKNSTVMIIINYMEYSGPTIIFEAEIKYIFSIGPLMPVNRNIRDSKSVNITVHEHKGTELYLYSILFDLRNIEYIHVTVIGEWKKDVRFTPWNSDSCTYCTLVYPPHKSNIRGRQYDIEVLNRESMRRDIIQSVTIDTSSCNAFIIPMWSVSITWKQLLVPSHYEVMLKGINTTHNAVLNYMVLWKQYKLQEEHSMAPFWYMVHMIKSAVIPPYAIWRVWMEACASLSRVAMEVPTDKHLSSVYKWNHFINSYNIYMTIDVAINLLFESDNIDNSCQDVFKILFHCHYDYNDRITQYTPGQTSDKNFFTLHKLR